jgi:hypothetical protein
MDGGAYMLSGGSRNEQDFALQKAMTGILSAIPQDLPTGFRDLFLGMCQPPEMRKADIQNVLKRLDDIVKPLNAVSRAFRANVRARQFKSLQELAKAGEISKAVLDVGTLTNFAQITGGQSLGYVSLDTQMARGTVRPNSFTLYQCLPKSGAFQVVDYWPYAWDTGGGLPGTAFQAFGNVSTGQLNTSAGKYSLYNITLKLAVNGRAITTALAAQNSFVDITAQENINAALTVLESVNWATYYGNPALYANQTQGILGVLPTANIFDFYEFQQATASHGWSASQTLFNLIYEAAAQITSYRQFGRITHAFMSPITAGSLQSLVTTVLNNIVSIITPSQERLTGIVVDGDLQGMRTRFGEIQFPIDLYIDARLKPAQAIIYEDGSNAAFLANPTRPTAVTVAATGVAAGSEWDATYTAGSGIYSYAAAACDASMNESYLTYMTGLSISGVAVGGAYIVTVEPAEATDNSFRIYRSGLGYVPTSSGAANPASYRYIGTVAANAGSNVTFTDLNTVKPGGETLFLLDLDENDAALDFRYLLPLTKIDLFAQNLFMPWAVAMIGSVRVKIPKFHGAILNFIPDNPDFNPLQPNPNAS